MMKKYREWAAKPYTRGDMVKSMKWSLIITLICEAVLWTWYYWDTIVCWFESVKLMVVSLMALVATSISMLTWYQVVGMFFAAIFMLFIGIELECGENKEEEL